MPLKRWLRNLFHPDGSTEVVLVNAVSAKFGGAQTIIESFYDSAKLKPHTKFVILAGFRNTNPAADNIEWIYRPMSGLPAVMFNIVGVLPSFIRHRCSKIISFNNINSPFIPASKRTTYFHQPKVLDKKINEKKVWVMRKYLEHTRERIIVQSPQVRDDFIEMFGQMRHPVFVAWPGISTPKHKTNTGRRLKELLIPVASPESPHKNFPFVIATARALGQDWQILVTAPEGSADLNGATNVRFLGTQPRNSLFELYRKASCVLMASTHETIGLPIFEALSVGTPVVAYDASYVRSFQEKFEITSGLEISSSPEDARRSILKLTSIEPTIRYGRDFRLSDWETLFDVM